tara:strand:+ start:980 stop:1429 length:450 start_codon:yes stop_codon:yes gene_type:complete
LTIKYFYIFIAILGGALLPIQAGLNAELARRVDSPILGALASFVVGGLALLTAAIIMRVNWPEWQTLKSYPLGLWIGGLFGAFIVFVTIVAAPRLGATALLGFILAGQMIAALVFDHHGFLGFPVQQVNIGRTFGVILVILGAIMIRRF